MGPNRHNMKWAIVAMYHLKDGLLRHVSSALTFLFSLATHSDGVSAVWRGRESGWHFPKGHTFEYLFTSVLSSPAGLLVPQFQAVGANGEVPGTDDLDAGAKRVNPEVKTISAAMDDKAGQTETLFFFTSMDR